MKWFWKSCKPNSVFALRRRESFVLATDTRNLFRFHETRSGPLLGFLFGLAPGGVFRAASLALRAVVSYTTFSPLPSEISNLRFETPKGGLIFCGTFRRKAFRLPARVYPSAISNLKFQKVTRRRALRCSDFPLPARAGSDSPPFQNRCKITGNGLLFKLRNILKKSREPPAIPMRASPAI